jgi:phosphate transport system substrate-binding protein
MGFHKEPSLKKSIVRPALFSICLLSVCGLSACGRGESAVVVAGSTSVQPYVELLAEEYAGVYGGHDVDVQGGGSSAGITAARSGVADIGMSSRALYESEDDLWSVEIARDGLAVIVHPSNPVRDLTLAQVRDIYSGAISNWSEVGGGDANIHIITREEGSGTRTAFEELVMDGVFIKAKAIVQDSNGAVKQIVSSDRNAVGFISLGLVDGSVRSVSLGGISPSAWAVRDGSYVLFRPFLFVTESVPRGHTMDFISYVLSPQGRLTLEKEGLVTYGDD